MDDGDKGQKHPSCLRPRGSTDDHLTPSPNAISRYTQVFLWELGSLPLPALPQGEDLFTDFTFVTFTQASSHA